MEKVGVTVLNPPTTQASSIPTETHYDHDALSDAGSRALFK